MKALGRQMPMNSSVMVVWILWGLTYGVLCVWLYVAIRPRFGPGAGSCARLPGIH